MNEFHSHGKLLLSGEYFILHGAKGLSIPLQKGQAMYVEQADDKQGIISWEVKDPDGHWFKAVLNKQTLKPLETDAPEKAQQLADTLKQAGKMKKNIFRDPYSYYVSCVLSFKKEWGFGSSSTFLSNIGYWLHIDALDLHFKVSQGSGYDVATAQINLPVVYKLYKSRYPVVRAVNFRPSFSDHLYFIYQGEKASSSKSIAGFKPEKKIRHTFIPEIDKITESMITCEHIDEFKHLMNRHEALIADALQMQGVNDSFPDFKGALKSLGAWGGDFMLAATTENEDYVKKYFYNKGLQVILPYRNLALYK